jgi:hypothetical protein
MIFLPCNSLKGPTNKGPNPSPTTNRLTPRIVTSLDTLNSLAMPVSVNAALIKTQIRRFETNAVKLTIDEEHVTHRAPELITNTAAHLLSLHQFFGSSSGSRVTSKGSFSIDIWASVVSWFSVADILIAM